MDCPICMDKFTKQAHRKPVECAYCATKACVRCIESHITISREDPHCFNCRRGWSFDFLEDNLPKTWFHGEFKKSREELLMDRERSQLPLAQAWAERMKQAKTVFEPAALVAREERTELISEYKNLSDRKNKIETFHRIKYREITNTYYSKLRDDNHSEEFKIFEKVYKASSKELRECLKDINRRIREINVVRKEVTIRESVNTRMRNLYLNSTDEQWAENQERIRIEAELRENNEAGADDPDIREALIASIMQTIKNPGEAKKIFTMKCPGMDCRGFLSTHYKCGLCDRSTCADCLLQHTVEDPEGNAHECKEEDKESVSAIKKSCRNCPSCGISIFRIEGCNQMFCTGCNTAFDWTTGRELVTKQIHNPHYTEYLRQLGRHEETAHAQPQHTDCNTRITPYLLNYSYINPYLYILYMYYGIKTGSIDPGASFQRKYKNMNSSNTTYKIPKNILSSLHKVSGYYAVLLHLESVLAPVYANKIRNNRNNRRLNAEYLNGYMDESKWKVELSKNEKDRIVTTEVQQTIDAFITIGHELYANFIQSYNAIIEDFTPHCREVFLSEYIDMKIMANIEPFYEKYFVSIQGVVDGLTKQLDSLKEIYNDKVKSMVRVYKIPCEEIVEMIQNSTMTVYRMIPIVYLDVEKKTRRSPRPTK